MPYVPKLEREQAGARPINPGQLNFAITMLLLGYLKNVGVRYTTLNDCMGALAGAQQEFYRRAVVPYENKKIAENGDVYD